CDYKVQQPSRYRSRGDNQPREINFGYEIRIAYQAVCGVRHSVGEVRPNQKTGIKEDWVRHSVIRNFREFSEEVSEDDHRHKRLQERPRRTEHRLLVPDLYVSPGKKVDKLAMRPHCAEIERRPGLARFDHHDRLLRQLESTLSVGGRYGTTLDLLFRSTRQFGLIGVLTRRKIHRTFEGGVFLGASLEIDNLSKCSFARESLSTKQCAVCSRQYAVGSRFGFRVSGSSD